MEIYPGKYLYSKSRAAPAEYTIVIEQTRRTIAKIVCAMVNHPNDVSVEFTVNEWNVEMLVRVRAEDRGQVIGRQGRLADSLRVVLSAIGQKQRVSYTLNID